MGKSAPQAPKAPDPSVVAGAQSAANIATATAQQKLNMVNATDPYGSVDYSRDPTAPGGYRQTTTLSPEQQGLYNLGTQAQTGALGIANDQLGRVSGALQTPLTAPSLQTSFGPTDFTADRNAITDAVIGQARSRLDPQWDLADNRQQTRLANQGLSQNDTAYRNQMDQFGRDRNDAYDQAIYSGIQQGANEQNTLFGQRAQQATFGNEALQQGFQNTAYAQNQPIDQLSALLSTGQLQGPQGAQYSPVNLGQSDVMGAYGLNSAAQNNAYQAQVANTNSNNSGMYGLGAAAISAAAIF